MASDPAAVSPPTEPEKKCSCDWLCPKCGLEYEDGISDRWRTPISPPVLAVIGTLVGVGKQRRANMAKRAKGEQPELSSE